MNNREQIDTVNQNYIYKDEIIELCSKDLKINKYYFPFMTSKVIPIDKIKNIRLTELNTFNGKYRIFGLSFPFIYYHLDIKRPSKTHAIFLEEENNFITIAITPDEPKKCFNSLRYLINNMKNKKQLKHKAYEEGLIKNGKID